MARIEEQIRKVQQELRDQPEVMRAAIADLHRHEALRVTAGMTAGMTIAPATKAKDWHVSLLETTAGKQAIQVKLESELKAQAREQALQVRLDIADRIRQLKELVHYTFVVLPRTAEPVNGWVPRIRFDLYQNSKESCRVIGQEGGEQYNKVITAVRYAMTGSKAYRAAIEILGL